MKYPKIVENSAGLSVVNPAGKLIVRTFEESKFHTYAIMIKFGVEITMHCSGTKKKWKETEKIGLVLILGWWTKTALGLPKVGHSTTAAEVYVRRGA